MVILKACFFILRFREVKGGWLKMPKTGGEDKEKEFLEKSVLTSTRYATKWSFNFLNGMLSLLFVGQFCIFLTFYNGINCDEDD